MAGSSAFTPKASLTEAPTNLKEAIDWVLRVTGRDGKALSGDECICGLAAAVTDLLQSVELEYNGYQGESNGTDPKKGPPKGNVTERLNELFSLVQGLGGTAVVRTYIDQLAQVLSALVGWSKLDKCWGSGDKCKGTNGDSKPHGGTGCGYLNDIEPDNNCEKCGCMKWNVTNADTEGTPLGRRCQRCSGSRDGCMCSGEQDCTPDKCQCAEAGKCCKCCCKSEHCKEKCQKNSLGGDKECICKNADDSYRSAYTSESYEKRVSFLVANRIDGKTYWRHVTSSTNRHQCARILLGSVCLIWSGLTYMYWTGKYHKSSPRWNNHILDGSGLDDGTLSQWLQALGFPKEILNNSGPGNRWDAIIWDGIMGKLYLGFPETGNGANVHGIDDNANTFRNPAGMNYAGYIHTVDRGAFCSNATIFHKNGTTITEENINKCGALYKLYILSCAYFTGLQKRTTESTPKTPKTIREILYWLSALPYSPAYPKILKHSIERLKSVAPVVGDKKQLSFYQTGRTAPITVDEFNLFAHFQAVTQYCPLVLIGIQGGLKGTGSTKEPAIHSLYANTECQFTYPTVSIQAYNQVVHYIRALFYQLYFLRKQCAVKVALGGKWRECRYGSGVLGKGVISWMCLGCSPMEHDRTKRVDKVKEELGKVVSQGGSGNLPGALKDVLEKIGDVVVQLGNAQEVLEGKKKEAINAVKTKLTEAKGELEGAKQELESEVGTGAEAGEGNGNGKLGEAKAKLDALTKGGNGILGELEKKLGDALRDVTNVDPGKNNISAAIKGVREVLDLIKEWAESKIKEQLKAKKDLEHVIKQELSNEYTTFLQAIEQLISICNSPKCSGCTKHGDKCGKPPKPTICKTCHQQYMDGTPSPLQAFLEDRLPGFSCDVVRDIEDPDKYPPAASHLGHCGGSGQCCPLPMGFRNNFQDGVTHTGARLYGILYFFSNGDMMQSCAYTLVRVTAALSATTPQVLGDVFGFFRGGVGNKERGKTPKGNDDTPCNHDGNPSGSYEENKTKYFCGWCASGLRDEVKKIEWIQKALGGKDYRTSVGTALIDIKGEKNDSSVLPLSNPSSTPSNLSTLTDGNHYVSPLTGELYTAVSATFGGTYLSWVLYLSDALQGGLESLASEFKEIECRGCIGCDPNKCKKGNHGTTGNSQCNCSSIVSCTGVLPVLYRHGFSYGNPFNLEGYQQKDGKTDGQYDIEDKKKERTKQCHQFLDSLSAVIDKNKQDTSKVASQNHPLTELLKQVGQLQYDIRLPWIFVLTVAWLVAVLYLAFGAIWPLDWTHMRSHCRGWFRKGSLSPWEILMVGKKKGRGILEFFGKEGLAEVKKDNSTLRTVLLSGAKGWGGG